MIRNMPKPPLIVGNWKMYKGVKETQSFIDQMMLAPLPSEKQIWLAVPFTAIGPAVQAAKGRLVIGAQNMHDASEGAFTGEIAASMLTELGTEFVILGHSERRTLFHESNTFIHRKVKAALQSGLKVILCVGETEQERKEEKTKEVLKTQLLECLKDVPEEAFTKISIAYEPIWAIGTGKTATPEIAQKTHRDIREILESMISSKAAQEVFLLYGGSVKPENASSLMKQEEINGLLIGNSSLKHELFLKIIHFDQS